MKGFDFMSNTEKIPFYQKGWFLALISVLFPIAGIIMMWKFKKKWHVAVKIILTVVASFWCMFLSLILLGMSVSGDTSAETTAETTEYTTSVNEEETMSQKHIEETSIKTTTTTVEETTNETTTEKTVTTTQKTTTTTKATTTQKSTTTTKKETTTSKPETTKPPTTTKKVTTTVNPDSQVTVYKTATGEKYHYENPCGNGTYYPITLEEAKARGLEPCGKCVLH